AVALTEQPVGTGGRLLFEAANLPAEQTAAGSIGTIASEYLVARVGGERCGAVRVPVTLRYRSPDFHGDFSRTVSVALGAGASAADVPAAVFYRFRPAADAADITDQWSDYQFRGVELDARDRECLERVERIADTRRFPLLLSATLGPGWQDGALYQTLASVERGHETPLRERIVPMPADLRLPRAILAAPLAPLTIAAHAD